jgi:hypothetical protein
MKRIKRMEVTFLDGTRLTVDGEGQITDVTTHSRIGAGKERQEWHYLQVVFTPREVGKE